MTSRHPGAFHVLTDEICQQRFSHVEIAELAVAGGADTIQYREKRGRSTRDLVATARGVLAAVKTGARVVVDDRVDVAIAAGADAVHLGRHDLDPVTARRLMGEDALIGGTANSLEEAIRVARGPIDYLGVGPVYGTQSKANPAPVLGLAALETIVAAVDIPVIAIGNITAPRVSEVMATGAHGVAVLSAVVAARDPGDAAARLREALDGCRESVRRDDVEVKR